MYVHPFAFDSIAASLADDAFRATASMPSPVSVAIKRCRNSSVEIEAFALLLNSTIPTFGRAAAGFDSGYACNRDARLHGIAAALILGVTGATSLWLARRRKRTDSEHAPEIA